MPFWVYMLHCRDRTFYVGHTDDLEVRIAQHERGLFGGYTASRRPLKLVWSAELPTREEALAFERRIKGWRREKKMALIRGDWAEISRLSKEKGRPSTSSGRSGEEEATAFPSTAGQSDRVAGSPERQTTNAPNRSSRPERVEGRSFFLQRHPQTPCDAARRLEVHVRRQAGALHLRYTLSGDTRALLIPPRTESRRTDELWRHTCFELFAALPDGGYREFNFSPSTQWAAYAFDSYRAGMRPLEVAPQIDASVAPRSLTVEVLLPLLAQSLRLNLAAVVEEKSGAKSYWALAHPPEGPPDFHDPACFILELPPMP